MNQLALISDFVPPFSSRRLAHAPPIASLNSSPPQIRNPHTRRAYARAAAEFFDWLETKGVTQLTAIESVHVATYIEQLSRARPGPTAKLRLAALRHLFDWMVIGQIMPANPAAAVRGPRHIVRRGKTPVLDAAEARQLIDKDRHDNRHWPPRPRLDRTDGLFVRAYRGVARNEGRRRLRAEPPSLGPLARKGRQAPRNALPPQPRNLPPRLH